MRQDQVQDLENQASVAPLTCPRMIGPDINLDLDRFGKSDSAVLGVVEIFNQRLPGSVPERLG